MRHLSLNTVLLYLKAVTLSLTALIQIINLQDKIFMTSIYISTNKKLLNIKRIHDLLKDCEWCKNIPIEYVERCIKHSLCFGVYNKDMKDIIGFGRVISDYTTYAYIGDIVIDPLYRRQGLATQLTHYILNYPKLKGIRRWTLVAMDESKAIYEKSGFNLVNPTNNMDIKIKDMYSQPDFINLYKKK